MESFEESNNCHSMSDSFSLYERYMRSFSVVEAAPESSFSERRISLRSNEVNDNTEQVNVDLSLLQNAPQEQLFMSVRNCHNIVEKNSNSNCCKEAYISDAELLDTSSVAETCSSVDKFEHTDVPVSSDDTKSNHSVNIKPVIITSLITMENSNNAVDSVPLFKDTQVSQTVFKLPITELTFNGTIKHVQKLKPMIDPITVLSSGIGELVNCEENGDSVDTSMLIPGIENSTIKHTSDSSSTNGLTDKSSNDANRTLDGFSESTGDSQYTEQNRINQGFDELTKSTLEHSLSSYEASFDSGVRSPDMFSDDDEPEVLEPVTNYWSFLRDFEEHDKKKVQNVEQILQGVLPPPSVTNIKTDAAEMLKKYNAFLPIYNGEETVDNNALATPTKKVSFITVPIEARLPDALQETEAFHENEEHMSNFQVIANLNKVSIKMCSEIEAKETSWPDLLKCRYFDVHYNITKYSETLEQLGQRIVERYISNETGSSVSLFSTSNQSPSSANKRKALRIKLAQGKSPSRRLSHLARRRQTFCSASTISERAHTSKMVLIDKNYFPHRKLTYSSDRKFSPRFKRTPSKKTPSKKTPSKKTPGKKTPGKKTPKTKSGGSSRKNRKNPDSAKTRAQPSRETLKRALFISPENRKLLQPVASTSAPQITKSKRALFSSPQTAETKSLDGTPSDSFLKRKRESFDNSNESKSKIAKSLTFGGDNIESTQSLQFERRASEVFSSRGGFYLSEIHRKKLLWAVSEALRSHGWRMGAPGFRTKASALAQLTRRLLSLPPHATRLATPSLSSSEIMLKLARQYTFAIIQGRSIDECYLEEQSKIAKEGHSKVSGYISASAYHQLKAKSTSQIKENTCDGQQSKPGPSRSATKNILQDKLVNVDARSNSSDLSSIDRSALFKSNSMPSFNEAAKMRARRQISFDNIDIPHR